MKNIILSAAILGLLFSSCKKEETISNKDLLTTGNWRISAHSSSFDINGVHQSKDYYADYLDCEKAALITFPKDEGSNIRYAPGGVTCPPNAVSSVWYPFYSNYRLLEHGSVLRFLDDQAIARDFKIDYIDSKVIKTTYRNSGTSDGKPYSEEIVLNFAHAD